MSWKKQPDRISCHASYRRDNKFTHSTNLLILKTNTISCTDINFHKFEKIPVIRVWSVCVVTFKVHDIFAICKLIATSVRIPDRQSFHSIWFSYYTFQYIAWLQIVWVRALLYYIQCYYILRNCLSNGLVSY